MGSSVTTGTRSLADKFNAEEGAFSMTGVEALVRVPLDVRRADIRADRHTAAYISGYEGSPLGGYDIALLGQKTELDRLDIVFHPGVNEELAATAVQGTQLAPTFDDARVSGVTGYWYGKSPGLDRASDAIRHANLSGTHPEGGAVIMVGDDPSAKSSTVPGASEPLLADLGIPTLYPATPQDVLDLGRHAVQMSRVSGLWTALKVVTNVADGSGMVNVDPARLRVVTPDITFAGRPYRHEVHSRMLQPHLTGLERSRNGERLELARRYASANSLDRISGARANARIGIVSAGKTGVDVMHALRRLGIDDNELIAQGIRILRLAMINPVDQNMLREFADGLIEIIVVEEKRSFLELAVKDALFGRPSAPRIVGKIAPDGAVLVPAEGELDPDVIADALARRLTLLGTVPSVESWRQQRDANRPRRQLSITPVSAANRTPYFCSGCPHSRSAKAPEGSLVGGGIGCHALVLVMPESQVGDVAGLTQMGGEGAQWNGMYPFLAREHLIQNIGDGTFHHSGSLAVRAAIAAGANITYKLLYNSAVAMTGGQTVTGGMTVPQITRALAAEGVSRMIITTRDPRRYSRKGLARGVEVWGQDRLVEAQEVLAATPGVTLLIHDQECATELRRKRKRGLAPDPATRVVINERVCEGCGDCGRVSNCLSVHPTQTEFGRKTQIDQSSCNKDYSCLDGDCPSFMTVTPRAKPHRLRGRRRARVFDGANLSDPTLPSAANGYTIRILGIGGSGVVTLSRILSFAAAAGDRYTQSLDQTGLAQKGGAVISDVRISDQPFEVASKAAAGEVDLYLGADLLVAANPINLLTADPSRTAAVVSTTQIPTGQMVVDTTIEFPDPGDLVSTIRAATRGDESVFFDARAYSEALFGDDQHANLLLLGAAYQSGRVPIPGEHIEAAIRANGVKADTNIAAFRRGRQLIDQPEQFEKEVAPLQPTAEATTAPLTAEEEAVIALVATSSESRLAELLRVRVPELVRFQDLAYARRYVGVVERVRARESALGSELLAETVAEYLFKLMAYKDEYEVARLLLSTAGAAAARQQFGDDARVSYRLHPPIFRAIGMKRKISLGTWSRPLFELLVVGRHLRGTALDIFGYAKVRRMERALIEEYLGEIDALLRTLDQESHPTAVAIAALPDIVRGYEHIKIRNVAAYHAELERLRSSLHGERIPAGSV